MTADELNAGQAIAEPTRGASGDPERCPCCGHADCEDLHCLEPILDGWE